MGIHNYNLLPKAKSRSNAVKAEIDLFPYAEELYSELERIGIIYRLSTIPHLGPIKVKSTLKKTRLDYVFLQLYFHQIIKEEQKAKGKLKTEFKYTYNSKLYDKDFCCESSFITKEKIVTIADVLQILSIIYSTGHFITLSQHHEQQ